MLTPARSASDVACDVHKDQAWLETMLAYSVNLLSQAQDLLPEDAYATTGPEDDPDRFDIASFIDEVRKFYPEF